MFSILLYSSIFATRQEFKELNDKITIIIMTESAASNYF